MIKNVEPSTYIVYLKDYLKECEDTKQRACNKDYRFYCQKQGIKLDAVTFYQAVKTPWNPLNKHFNFIVNKIFEFNRP
jgi:hypothetical protein